MSGSTRRLIALGFVAGVATVSLGVAAYAAGAGQLVAAAAPAAISAPTAAATPAATSVTTPAPTPTVVPKSADVEDSTLEDSTVEDSTLEDPALADDDVAQPGDGNVVEVRTPNPDAVPKTPEEHAHFYGLITDCMSTAGYDWHGVWLSPDNTFAGVDLTQVGDIEPDRQAGFTLALYGDTGGGDYYHWADAGCWGYAVHVTGNDGNN